MLVRLSKYPLLLLFTSHLLSFCLLLSVSSFSFAGFILLWFSLSLCQSIRMSCLSIFLSAFSFAGFILLWFSLSLCQSIRMSCLSIFLSASLKCNLPNWYSIIIINQSSQPWTTTTISRCLELQTTAVTWFSFRYEIPRPQHCKTTTEQLTDIAAERQIYIYHKL